MTVRVRGAFVALARGAAAAAALASGARAQGTIEGTVYDSLVMRGPLRGATVHLVGATGVATTDARGRFTMPGVAAGPYTITFGHAALDSAGLQAPQFPIRVVDGGRSRIALTTPSDRTVIAANCPGPRAEATGLLLGTVRDVDTGAPLAGARVRSRWFEMSLGGDGARHEVLEVSAESNAAGVYRLCGLPTDIPVFVRAVAGTQQSGPVELHGKDSGVLSHDFFVSARDSAARVVADSVVDTYADSLASVAAAPVGSARLAGVVRDQSDRPVPNASIRVLDRPEATRTDSAGRFSFAGVPAGTQTLDLRALGFAPVRYAVVLRPDSANTAEIRVDRSAQALAPVRVLGQRAASARSTSGFEERRRRGTGWYVTADEIARQGAIYAGDLLRRAPGLMGEYSASGERNFTMRGNSSGRRCRPTYYLDGHRWFPLSQGAIVELERFIMTSDIHGIEVYNGGAATPAAFDTGTGCGVVLIWTKR